MSWLGTTKRRILFGTLTGAGVGAILLFLSHLGDEKSYIVAAASDKANRLPSDNVTSVKADNNHDHHASNRAPKLFGDAVAPSSTDYITAIERRLLEFDGKTDHQVVAKCLSEVRDLGKRARSLKQTLLTLVSQRANIYEGRIKSEVIRLRAYVLLALVDTGNANAAFPYVCDYVRNSNDYGLAYEAGAGARAAGALGSAGSELIEDLITLFYREFNEPEFSLERYSLEFPAQEATTVKLEIIKAFHRIGFANNERVDSLLQTCAIKGNLSLDGDSRIAEAASSALLDAASADGRGAIVDEPLRLEVNRTSKDLGGKLEIDYVDQEGRQGLLADLIDRPTAIVFFYTRCTNAQKCSTVVSRIAQLQQMLSDQGAREKVRLIGITYEPKSDDAVRLKNYGLGRNVQFDDSTRFLRLDPKQHASLISLLDVPVSYSDGWVNTHGIVLFVITESHELVARYEAVTWENEKVLRELLSIVRNR